MNRFLMKANLLLMTAVVALGMTYAYAQLEFGNPLDEPGDWDPGEATNSLCESTIFMLSACPSGTESGWNLPIVICKTDGTFCCQYLAHPRHCYVYTGEERTTTVPYSGYAAEFLHEVPNSHCPGTGEDIFCEPLEADPTQTPAPTQPPL